ncbi:hypothetical protein [Prevotella pallens]|uniref:hypothetical protein n=1 Tax=Prevotella pallens TaxID=60133 RepID=UPI001CB61FC7|nr:hypothetical protein [Prevotella pallens]MBF1493181.1 hypothetical protein [Prevotella pallens]
MYSLYVGVRVPFRGSCGICECDKSGPYSCEQIAIMRGEHTPLGERTAIMRGEMNGDK